MTQQINATSKQSRFHAATLDTAASSNIDLETVCIAVGEHQVIRDANLRLKAGVKYALVGRNGAGKTTLLKAIAEKLIPGLSSSLRIAMVSQSPDAGQETTDMTALEFVLHGDVERRSALEERDILMKALDSANPKVSQRLLNGLLLTRAEEALFEGKKAASQRSGMRGKEARARELNLEQDLADAQSRLEKNELEEDWAHKASEILSEVELTLEVIDADSAESEALRILRGLGFSDTMIQGRYVDLSGGWRSRCSLATGLLVSSDILILDEPSNFMDLETILWLEKQLTALDQTLIITSHDQTFLDRVSEETIVLRDGNLSYFEGTPTTMDVVKAEERRAKEKVLAALDKKKEHIVQSIAEGKRSAKSSGDENRMRMIKSREKKLEDRWGAERSEKGGRFKRNRDMAGFHLSSRPDITLEEVEADLHLKIEDPAELRTSEELVRLDKVDVGYKSNIIILRAVSLAIQQGGRLALLGPNGHGKSTIAKTIVGELSSKTGVISRHPRLKIGYYSQHEVEILSQDGSSTPLAHLMTTNPSVAEKTARGYLGRWGFGGKLASATLISSLSGGQKVRLALALMLLEPPSLLILDEVTTHLDSATIRALALALRDYKGGILLITHDRLFSKIVVEGQRLPDEDAEGEPQKQVPGTTLLIKGGKVKLLEGGMIDYERSVERSWQRKAMKAKLV